MSGGPPYDPVDADGNVSNSFLDNTGSNPANVSFGGGNYIGVSADAIAALTYSQVAIAMQRNPSDVPGSATRDPSSMKRSAEEYGEADISSKRQLETDFRRGESNMDVYLGGRAWGPNVLMEPSGNNHNSFLSLLPSNQNLSSNFSANLEGGATGSNAATGQDFTRLFRDHVARSQANAMLLAQFGGSNIQFGGTHLDMFGANRQHQQGMPWGNQWQGQVGIASAQQRAEQYASLQSFAQMDHLRQGNAGMNQPSTAYSSVLTAQANSQPERQKELSALLRQLSATSSSPPSRPAGILNFGTSRAAQIVDPPTSLEPLRATLSEQHSLSQQTSPLQQRALELPPCEEGTLHSHSTRPYFPLGIEEDPNWLSEFHCFVRSDVVEVFRASRDDVKARNNSIAYKQVGLRCRFCAHVIPSARSGRSSAFPSSLRQIYQSFTMMLRDHFANCDSMPTYIQDKFLVLKDKPAQGATDSKRYWIYSAMKIGMVDTAEGLLITDETRMNGIKSPPFGSVTSQTWEDDSFRDVALVVPGDRPLVVEFLFLLMSQVQPIRLTESECIGNRRSLRVGLPGFGCRYCCEQKRLGLCRMFPARRRTLPSKVNDLYDHLRRCSLCPKPVKDMIENAKHQMSTGFHADLGGDREFFDRVWSRLGHPG